MVGLLLHIIKEYIGVITAKYSNRRTYTQRAAQRGRRRRVRQWWQGIFDFVKKVASNSLVKSIARQGLKYSPAPYANLIERVKNKTLKRILNSDIAHSMLNGSISATNRRLR